MKDGPSREFSVIGFIASASGATLGVGVIYQTFFFQPFLASILGTADGRLDSFWSRAVFVIPLGVVLGFLVLALLASCAAGKLRGRAAAYATLGVSTAVVITGLFADMYLYRMFGRHVADVVYYALEPGGHQAAGKPLVWVLRSLKWLGSGALFAVVAVLLSLLLGRAMGRMSRTSVAALGSLFLGLHVLAGAAVWFLTSALPEGFGPRLAAALPVYPRSNHVSRTGALGKLEAAFTDEYRKRFGHLFAPPEPVGLHAEHAPSSLPSLALIVAESLRADVFGPELMPELYAWSERGLRLERHYAGTNHSETGMFTLLYGRSALTYHSTLNARTKPTFCEALRPLGYECGYFTGHPHHWLRREEFLNESTVARFERNDSGDWTEWDARALERASAFLKERERRVAIVFLMSSHYEYRYPKENARFTPDDPPRVAWLADAASTAEFTSNRNRYFNAVGFVDRIVRRHIETLDVSRTWIVFTGDHGESTGEDGRFGHGYNFSERLTRVPFVLAAPGVASGKVTHITSHVDLFSTFLSQVMDLDQAGTGQPFPSADPRSSLLLAYPGPNRREADALLLVDDVRLALRFDLRAPDVELLGFETVTGAPTHVDLTERTAASLLGAFSSELERAGGQARNAGRLRR